LFVVFFTFCFGFNDNNDLGQSTLVNNLGQQPWSTTLVNNLGQQPWSTTLVNNLGQQPWSTTWSTTLVNNLGQQESHSTSTHSAKRFERTKHSFQKVYFGFWSDIITSPTKRWLG